MYVINYYIYIYCRGSERYLFISFTCGANSLLNLQLIYNKRIFFQTQSIRLFYQVLYSLYKYCKHIISQTWLIYRGCFINIDEVLYNGLRSILIIHPSVGKPLVVGFSVFKLPRLSLLLFLFHNYYNSLFKNLVLHHISFRSSD